MIAIDTLPSSEVNEPVYQVILPRYPQIHLFEHVSNPQDWEVLYAVESLTNPRLRDEVGDIRLVPPEDRVYGDGASWIMAAINSVSLLTNACEAIRTLDRHSGSV